ncbi:MAG: hypothetical protein Q7R41_17515, partial [Phycisphaerales bacterium]|nr:hypothetical protein [Phycisphaerales bacterium]
RFKVELRKEVIRYVKRECNSTERAAFYCELERVIEDPISYSEAIFDPEVSRYLLRFFRFAGSLAIFEFDPTKQRIIVRVCRKTKPIQPPRRSQGDSP